MPNWESFTRRSAPIVVQPFVSVQRKGIISLNRAAFEALGAPEAVELLFDRSECLMGMRPTEPKTASAYPVRKQTSNWVVAGIAFANFYGIDTSVARRYPAQLKDGVLTVDLKQQGAEVPDARTSRRVAAAT